MNFTLTEQQQMLRDSLRGYLAERSGGTAIRPGSRPPTGPKSPLWQGLASDIGLLALPFAEAQGGLGLGAGEIMVAMEELGRAMVNEPVLEGVVMAQALLAHLPGERTAAIVAEIAAGNSLVTFAHLEAEVRDDPYDVQLSAREQDGRFLLNGRKAVVTGGATADWIIVSARTSGKRHDADGLALFLLPGTAEGLTRREYRLLDGRQASDLIFSDVTVDPSSAIGAPGKAAPIVDEVLDRATAALCAEAVGIMRRLVIDTLDYAQNRRQGGTALSDHQVVQHRIVDMALQVEQASALTHAATIKLDASVEERAMAVSAAKTFVTKGVKAVGQAAVQLHGGMGMTDEIAIGTLFRRATMIERQLGSVDHHVGRWERLSLPPKAA